MSTEEADELMKLIACFSECGVQGGNSSTLEALAPELRGSASVAIAGVLEDLQHELSQHSDSLNLDFAPIQLPPEITIASPSQATDTGSAEWLFVDT